MLGSHLVFPLVFVPMPGAGHHGFSRLNPSLALTDFHADLKCSLRPIISNRYCFFTGLGKREV